MAKTRVLSWFLYLVAVFTVIPSALFLARNGLGFSLSDVLDRLVNSVDALLAETLGALIDPAVKIFFRWLREQFDLPLHLQPHWRHVFVVLWLFFSAYGKATTSAWFDRTMLWRFSTALVCAMIFAIAAGSVTLTALSVVYWPLAGFYAFLWLNEFDHQGKGYLFRIFIGISVVILLLFGPGFWWLGELELSVPMLVLALFVVLTAMYVLLFGMPSHRSTDYLVRMGLLSAFGFYFTFDFPIGFVGLSNFAPSVPLLTLALFVALFAFYLLLFGMPGQAPAGGTWWQQRVADPGTRIAGFVLVPVLFAMLFSWLSFRLPQLTERPPSGTVFGDGTFQDCEWCPRMARIPAGKFAMGSARVEIAAAVKLGAPESSFDLEAPVHDVRVPAFSLGVTEVTRGQFEAFLRDAHHDVGGYCGSSNGLEGGRTWHDPGFRQDAEHPVVCVSHWDAVKYAEWLTRKTGHEYRLPTEAEWEYAARSGSGASSYWGERKQDACDYANVLDTSRATALQMTAEFPCNDGYAYTAPVGKFHANAFRVHDMIGNVREWTLDCFRMYDAAPFDDSPSRSSNCRDTMFSAWPMDCFRIFTGPSEFPRSWLADCSAGAASLMGVRAVRGGSSATYQWVDRFTQRDFLAVAQRQDDVGFRVARTD